MIMQQVILDTDTLSELLKGKDPVVAAHAAQYAATHSRFTITAVTAHEIIFGLVSKGAARQLAEARIVFEANDIILPTLEDFETAGEVRGRARRLGQQLAIDDSLIAAVAARLGLPLVTGNTTHFQAARDAGLAIDLINWRTP